MKVLQNKITDYNKGVGMMNFDGDRMFKLLELEANEEGQVLFVEDVAEYEEFKEHLHEIDKLTLREKEELLHHAIMWVSAVARESFVTGFEGIKESRPARTDRLDRKNA